MNTNFIFLLLLGSVLTGIVLADNPQTSLITQTLSNDSENIKTEVQTEPEKEYLKKIEQIKKEHRSETQTINGELQQEIDKVQKHSSRTIYWCLGIAVIVFIVITLRFLPTGKIFNADFDELVICSLINLLNHKMLNPPKDLKQIIIDVVKKNKKRDSLLRDFPRAEYTIEKADTNKYLLTVRILHIVNSSEAKNIQAASVITWDELPSEIRDDFIRNQKTEQTYLVPVHGYFRYCSRSFKTLL